MSSSATVRVETGSIIRADRECEARVLVRELYAEHSTRIWRSLRRLGVPESSIEDAVQDVFLGAHRRAESFEGRSTAMTWLYGIARRVAKDHRRAQMRRERREEKLRGEPSIDALPSEGPAEAVARREANHLLHRLLDQLPESEREVFVLVDLEGMEMREAAQAAGLHLRTCQRRLKAARIAFEAALLQNQQATPALGEAK